jgi:uncharacterized RDD family membrane protein YckC
VDVARYRADLAAASAVPVPAVAPTAPPGAATTHAAALTPAPLPPNAEAAPPLSVPIGAPLHPAGFWIRAGAVLIDVVLVMAAEAAFTLVMWVLADDRLAAAASRAFRFLASPCYFVFLHWTRGQTVGKMAFRIRVVSRDGGPLSFGQSALRHLGAWVSAVILGIGYLLAAFRADKRGLHDLIAGTRVEHVT